MVKVKPIFMVQVNFQVNPKDLQDKKHSDPVKWRFYGPKD